MVYKQSDTAYCNWLKKLNHKVKIIFYLASPAITMFIQNSQITVQASEHFVTNPIFYYRKGTEHLRNYCSQRSEILATGSPFGPHRNAMDVDPEIRIREIRIFRKFFFRFFSLLRTPWGLRVTPRRFPYHLIRIRTGKSGFFENPFFSFFRLFELKKTLQYGCLWTRLDPTRSPVPVPRYITVLNST